MVGAAMERQANAKPDSAKYGYLSVLKAKLEVSRGENEKAFSLYKDGFNLTGKPHFLLWGVKALLGKPKTRNKGLEVLEEIEAGKYFNPSLQQNRLDNLRKKINVNDFNFLL